MFFTLQTYDKHAGKVEFFPTEAAMQHAADRDDAWAIGSPEDLKDVTSYQLVKAFNLAAAELHKYSPADAPEHVKKFADKRTAIERLWRLLTRINFERIERGGRKPRAKAPAVQRERKPSKGINIAPKYWVNECRAGSKQQVMVDLLSREEGATLDQLREALSGGLKPWADQTIKAGFNWDMNSLKGYGVRTETAEDGTQTYFLVIPEGLDIPEPRKVSKAPGGALALHSCDTIAETTDGLSKEASADLWAAMEHAKPSKVDRENAAPQDVLGERTPAKLWKHLSGKTQHELLVLFS